MKKASKIIIFSILIPALVAVIVTYCMTAHAADVGLAWDANTEADLAGYKIYYGTMSRDQVIGSIEAWCEAKEPKNEKCVAEWEKICTQDGTVDRSCHAMLYGYDHVVDVGNVTSWTITGLQEGEVYFFAATAYDKDDNESAFSKELPYKVPFYLPGQAGNLQQRPLEVLKFGGKFPDPIKGEVP